MPRLILVPTPIGNLEDITLRALNVLRRVSLILAEDTRTSGLLLQHYEIKCPMQSYHKFNEHTALERLCERIMVEGEVALITDAGTPAISDPGYLLVRACLDRGIEVECFPRISFHSRASCLLRKDDRRRCRRSPEPIERRSCMNLPIVY